MCLWSVRWRIDKRLGRFFQPTNQSPKLVVHKYNGKGQVGATKDKEDMCPTKC